MTPKGLRMTTRKTLPFAAAFLILVSGPACGDDTATTDTGTPDSGTTDTGTADTGGGDTGGGDTGGGDTGGGDTGADGGMPLNGCTMAAAMDMTGMAAVTITDISPWSVPHNACIIVSDGTVVTWQGNFTSHPLAGGPVGMTDAASPITMAGPGTGMMDISVTLAADGAEEGIFPYYCTVHLDTMAGVIVVVP